MGTEEEVRYEGPQSEEGETQSRGQLEAFESFSPEEWLDNTVILRKDNLEEIYNTN